MSPLRFDEEAASGSRKIRESDVESAFVARVESLGGRAEKFTSPARRSVPDRLVTFPNGYICFVELKAPGKVPTAAQEKDHARRRAMNCRVDVIDTVEAAKAWHP